MKMGQLMSMDTGDILPPELTQIMARLRDDAHVMPPKQLKSVLNDQWGDGWLRRFKRFDVRPIAAASIGQVHRAITKDGRDLAIKVQYPGVARSIDSDVSNVGALIRMTGLLPKDFALSPYLEEAKADAIRNKVATDLIDLMLREVFAFSVMQTDPNFANYRYMADTGQIVLLDFGATRALGQDLTENYRAIMGAGLSGDRAGLRDAALRIGFITPDIAPGHENQILDMMETVFSAITSAPVYDFGDTTLSQTMQRQGMALADDGFVPPPLPMEALFLQRKFAGMFLLAARLGASVPVADMIRRWV